MDRFIGSEEFEIDDIAYTTGRIARFNGHPTSIVDEIYPEKSLKKISFRIGYVDEDFDLEEHGKCSEGWNTYYFYK
jgi:hypothetical protein